MSAESPTPQGYGHDAKGAAGGKNVPDGRVTVAHSEPVGTVGGKGSGPQIIEFELDGQQVEAEPARPSGRSPSARAAKFRTCAIRRSRTTGPTAIAAPAWWRSKASGCWRRPASARRASA